MQSTDDVIFMKTKIIQCLDEQHKKDLLSLYQGAWWSKDRTHEDVEGDCLAKTRRGTLCQAPAIRGRSKCRLHGCGKGSGAPRGNQHALKDGQSTAQVKAFKKEVRQLIRQSQELLKKID